MARVGAAGMTTDGKEVVTGSRPLVGVGGKGGQVQPFDGIVDHAGDLGPVAFLGEALEVDDQTFGEALDGEELGAALPALAFSAHLQ